MANDYSIAIHNFISEKIAAAVDRKKIAEHQNDLAAANYYNGQLQELNDLRHYMKKRIDLKTQKYY